MKEHLRHYKQIFTGIILIFISLSSIAQPPGTNTCTRWIVTPTDLNDIENNYPWQLVYEDDFEGNALDLTKWIPIEGVARDPEHDFTHQWYSPNNISFLNGILKLTGKHQTLLNQCWTAWYSTGPVNYCEDFEYSSGEINSKYLFKYGKYEIRCKIPYGQGYFPAFWTYGKDGVITGELDCFEFYDNNVFRQGTNIHAEDFYSCGQDIMGDDYSASFHTFSIVWTPSYIEWYLGDINPVLIRRLNKYDLIDPYFMDLMFGAGNWDASSDPYWETKAFPTTSMRIYANLAIENTVDPSAFPGAFEIDYIRFYEKRPCLENLNIVQVNLNTTLANTTHYHSLSGNNINIWNASINNGQQLQLSACNEIVLSPGFQALQGSNFNAKADEKFCCTSARSMSTTESDDLANKTIEVIENNNQLNVYPNPTNGLFSIKSFIKDNGINDITILNVLGEVVEVKGRLEDEILTFDISEYPKGVYILKIISSNKTFIKKIIYN